MKRLFVLGAILSLWACKEKDLTGKNPELPDGNVELAISYIYGERSLHPDSLLTNNNGDLFFIDNVKILISDFYVVNDEDTLRFEDDFYSFSFNNPAQLVADIPAGGYSGPYGFRIGMDSNQVKRVIEESLVNKGGLSDPDIIRNSGNGYNSLYITGRLIDPNDINDTVGKIPFTYEVGGPELFRDFESRLMNYSVTGVKKAKLILNVDPEPIFRNLNIPQVLSVTSDKTNNIDYRNATFMMDTLRVGLF